MRTRITIFIGVFQSLMFLAHWFLYETWTAFSPAPDPPGISTLQAALALLSVSFITASLLAQRYSHVLVRAFYTLAAAWLGVLSFCFLASCACWALYAAATLLGLHPERHVLAAVLFGAALFASLYAIVNAARVRVNRVAVRLPNLPQSWRGRVAALVSDTHLGHVRGRGFMRRIVKLLARLHPDVVFIAGDLYDGTAADFDHLASPWTEYAPPLGTYYIAGNHEGFSARERYLDAVTKAGVRVLNNEKVIADGLQLVGVHYGESSDAERFRSILRRAALDHGRASILLTHAPHNLTVAEEEGVSLQLCGHTHGGQFFPFTWITSRIYGRFVYGLNRLRDLMVYTSYGAGTWGPPMRLGTNPEIVLIRFE